MKNHTKGATKLKGSAKPEETLDLRDPAHLLSCTRAALRLITGKWKGEIMWTLKDDKRRFGELMRAMPGITQHMLTTQLRDLERHGLVTRTVYAEVPPRVEYRLTDLGCTLLDIIQALVEWTEEHQASIARARVEFDARTAGAHDS